MTTRLVPGGSWSSLLAFLEPENARAIETLARPLEILIEDVDRPAPGAGEPDGYGGIDRHGDLERLLLSEWLLADEEPLEFSRRLAMSEIAFLRREHVEPRSSTRLVALLDCGPDQLGAPRLVHLAGLAVLSRRAERLGTTLEIGVLGEPAGQFHVGTLAEVARRWMRGRSPVRPTASEVESWLATLAPADRIWLFGANFAAAAIAAASDRPLRFRHLDVSEHEWGVEGATAVAVRVGRREVHLPLPEPATGVALIRGEGLHRATGPTVSRTGLRVRFPRFTGSTRRLLCRSDRPDELVAITIPEQAGRSSPRAKRHRFRGPVIAAAAIGPRTVALVLHEGRIHVEIVGKRLGAVGSILLPPEALELDSAAIDRSVEADLAPLLFAGKRLLVRVDHQWWALEPPDVAERVSFDAAGPTFASDKPWVVRSSAHRLRFGHDGAQPATDGRVLLGPRETKATELTDGSFEVEGRWTGDSLDSCRLRAASDEHVLGVSATAEGGPFLLVASTGGRILRLVGDGGTTRTLTQASGEILDTALHPLLPLLAVLRTDGTIEVFELPDGHPVAVVRSGGDAL